MREDQEIVCPVCRRTVRGYTANGNHTQVLVYRHGPHNSTCRGSNQSGLPMHPEDVAVRSAAATINRKQVLYTLAAHFRGLVKRAETLGFAVVADSATIAIRIVEKAEANSDNITAAGEAIRVHNACGVAATDNIWDGR